MKFISLHPLMLFRTNQLGLLFAIRHVFLELFESSFLSGRQLCFRLLGVMDLVIYP